jgi:hypothetical protein
VHRQRQRGRRGGGGEPALRTNQLSQRRSAAAPFGGHCATQIAGGHELVEVLMEEAVVTVVAGCPGAEAFEHLVVELVKRPDVNGR